MGRVNRASAGTTGEGSRVREGEEKEELATFGWWANGNDDAANRVRPTILGW